MRRLARVPAPRSGFAGFRFPPEVIMVVVRWYLRYALSYRDVEEPLAERGITVDPSPLVHTLRVMGSAQRRTRGRAQGGGWVVGVGGAAGGDLLPDLQGPG
jgi:transposase-like protein